MSVIVYIEHTEGIVKKNALEAASYAVDFANAVGESVTAVALGEVSDDELKKVGTVGVSKVIKVAGDSYVNHQKVAAALNTVAAQLNATAVIFAGSTEGKGAGSRLAIKMDAGIATEVVSVPESGSSLAVKMKAFSGKGYAHVELVGAKNIIVISTNSYGIKEVAVDCVIEAGNGDDDTTVLKHVSFDRDTESVSLPDAELVVSAGRGLKGPENWNIIEELANTLGAATACSKPVSDIGWRGHHEHVGQTGIAISPNLYIAIGISGAIQHLAGVSSSKTIVVINTDSEAPFFKAADYGIVGDAFEVVPKLTAAIKAIKA